VDAGPETDLPFGADQTLIDDEGTLDGRGIDATRPGDSRTDGVAPRDADPRDLVSSDLLATDLGSPCSNDLNGTLDDRQAYSQTLRCLADPLASTTTKRATIDAFVTLVEARGGFPIVEGGHVIFVYVDDPRWDVDDDTLHDEDYDPAQRKPPLRVAGSFNQWNTQGLTLMHAGLGFYHLDTAISGATSTARYRYKFIAKDAQGQDVWFSDPLSRRFGYDTFGRYALIRGGIDTSGKAIGHLEWIRNIPSKVLGGVNRKIYIYVPRNYDSPTAKTTHYPVLYLQDGNNAFDPHQPNSNGTWDADGVADHEIDTGMAKEMIIVAIPNNAHRMEEYTPVADIITSGGQPVGGKGDLYVDYLVKELKPVIDARYRTFADKDHTAILGSSLGGLIAFHAGLRYPAVFKYVGGMSSTLAWGTFGLHNTTTPQSYAAIANLSGRHQVYYLDSGGGPPCPSGTDNYCETLSFRDQLIAQGISTLPQDPNVWPIQPPNVNLYYHHEADAQHNEAAWHQRLYRALRVFFRP